MKSLPPEFRSWLWHIGEEPEVIEALEVLHADAVDSLRDAGCPAEELTAAANGIEAQYLVDFSQYAGSQLLWKHARFLASKPSLMPLVKYLLRTARGPNERENVATLLTRARRLNNEVRYGRRRKPRKV